MNRGHRGIPSGLRLAAAIAAVLSCTQLHAQAASQPSTPDAQTRQSKPSARVTTLGTIIVTATRRTETLQKVPMPISVMTYHDIQREHLQDFMDYAAAVPGLNVVSSGPGLTELSIRGIASGSQQPSASVGVYIDDTPFGSSSVFAAGATLTPDIDPADLERIEVLRGPQGTLYGAGALGGVIRFITIPPDTENYSGRLQVGGTSVSGGGNGFKRAWHGQPAAGPGQIGDPRQCVRRDRSGIHQRRRLGQDRRKRKQGQGRPG